jgi:Dyp-type peroxidase family
MPINLDNELQPINPSDAKYAQMLDNLQGNILKGHGREHTVHIFLELKPGKAAREQLAAFASRIVTSASQQHIETGQFKKFKIPGGLFANVLFTAKGYRTLGFTKANLNKAFPEPAGDFGIQSNFLEGMRAHADELNDPDPSQWEEGYRDGRIDAMILLADDNEDFLSRRARDLINELDDFTIILAVERGTALRTDEGEGIEHFGYVDGRSQPIFFTTDLEGEGQIDKWNPSEPLKIVLVPDRTVKDVDAFGSYFVFRKLEQDVLRFTVREHALADELKLQGADRERAGAMAVGRFRDGTPLALTQTDGFIPSKENNFRFDDADPDGLKCPFHAHIRKTNPRGDIANKLVPGGDEFDLERRRRITRRGIPYGTRSRHPNAFQALDDLPTKDVGLLFMCFQSSIANQFVFMQRAWANEEAFLLSDTGADPIIAQAAQGAQPMPQQWNEQWGGSEKKPSTFGEFVKMKGGEFFFAPSIPFLKRLAPPS